MNQLDDLRLVSNEEVGAVTRNVILTGATAGSIFETRRLVALAFVLRANPSPINRLLALRVA